MRVYVAGPITKGDQFLNVRAAIDAADTLLKAGHAPFVPHINVLWHMVHEHDYETWMAWDDAFLQVCDALLRIPGDSPGADREVERARELGIPVFFDVFDCLASVLEAAA